MSAWPSFSEWLRILRWYFTTIAVLLGTGILGLPVSLASSGFWPFVLSFTVTLFMQSALVLVQTDTLVLAHKALPAIDLHTLGKHLLPSGTSKLFDFMLLATFISVLISYALAAASAFSDVTGASARTVLTPFVVVSSTLIMFFPQTVGTVISIFTGAKVAVLTLVVCLVGIVASSVRITPLDTWTSAGEPFLVGTVAIGGITQLMPVVFPIDNISLRSLRQYRWSIIGGVFTCYLLNILWARFVLGVVPQTKEDAADYGYEVSLEAAAEKGEIATVPVTDIIQQNFPRFEWIRWTLVVFVILSIIVSYQAVGIGLRHFLCGMSTTVASKLPWRCLSNRVSSTSATRSIQCLVQSEATVSQLILFLLAFTCIWAIAFGEPSGFLVVLGTFTSLAINYACCVAVAHLHISVLDLAASPPTATGGATESSNSEQGAPVDETKPLLVQTVPADAASPEQVPLELRSPTGPLLMFSPLVGRLVSMTIFLFFSFAICFDGYNWMASLLTPLHGFATAWLLSLVLTRAHGFCMVRSVLKQGPRVTSGDHNDSPRTAQRLPKWSSVLDFTSLWNELISGAFVYLSICFHASLDGGVSLALGTVVMTLHLIGWPIVNVPVSRWASVARVVLSLGGGIIGIGFCASSFMLGGLPAGLVGVFYCVFYLASGAHGFLFGFANAQT